MLWIYTQCFANKLRLNDIPDKYDEINGLRWDKERTKNRNKTFIKSAFDEFAIEHKTFKPMTFKQWQELQKSPHEKQDKFISETIKYIK